MTVSNFNALLLLLALAPLGVPASGSELTPSQRRQDAIKAGREGITALLRLEEALLDADPLVRRAAIRSLWQIGTPAMEPLLQSAKTENDLLARRTAVRAVAQLTTGRERLAFLKTALHDPDDLVRVAALDELLALEPDHAATLPLLTQAQKDPSPLVSQRASQALWPYHQEVASVRERPEFRDTQLNTVSRIALPDTGWKFHTDPNQSGHLAGWQGTGFNDGDWSPIGIQRSWQSFGHSYEGVAWYRLTFQLPPQPEHDGVDLVFEGVDESAWIWINGEYAGSHDLGPEGHNQPFAVDGSDRLRWGAENLFVVRVSKPAGTHAGIWKPVYLEILKK